MNDRNPSRVLNAHSEYYRIPPVFHSTDLRAELKSAQGGRPKAEAIFFGKAIA
jgi:hypothetical protein